MLALIAYFLISHVVSFLCSIYESVLLSCTSSYIALLKKQGLQAGYILEELKGRIDRPLSAILTLNTFAHTIGAAGVGASVVEVYGEKWLAIGSVVLTLTMLYWTELLPKTIGALYWKALAPSCARPIKVMMHLTFPIVYSFNFFARILARGKKTSVLTEEDIHMALEAGARAGIIEEAEQGMVENIFRLGDRRVGMLMTPRVDIEWLDISATLEEIKRKVIAFKHSKFPVCNKDIDKVEGFVDARDFLESLLLHKELNLGALIHPPLFVNEHQHIFELMESFKKSHHKLAMVTDEYGSVQGMITIGDVFNAIVKDIDEGPFPGDSQILKVNNRSFLLDGKLPIDEFKEIFHLDTLPEEERACYRTLSGLCMTMLSAIPKKGDFFTINNMRFEILKVRKRRVEKVLLTRQDIPIAR